MAIYLQIDGVKGSVTEEKHKEWIEISNFQMGAHRFIDMHVGGTANRNASKPHLDEISFAKKTDASSGKLFQLLIDDKAQGKKVKIEMVDGNDVYTTYELENAMVSNFVMQSGDGAGNEHVSLSFTKITAKFTPRGIDNKPAAPIAVIYDLAAAKKG